MSRALHRWIATSFGLFLIWLIATGTLTACWQLVSPPPEFRPPPPSPPNRTLSVADIDASKVARLADSVWHPAPGAHRVIQIVLTPHGKVWEAVVTVDGNAQHPERFDLDTGARLPTVPGRPAPSLGQELVGLHSGAFAGLIGQFCVVGMGVALQALFLSGLTLYFPMHARRRSAGKFGLFWK